MQDYCSKPKENVSPHNPAHVDNKKSQIFLTITPQAAINQIPIHFMTVAEPKTIKGTVWSYV